MNREMVKKDANNIELFMESQGYILKKEEGWITSKQLVLIYEAWCDENAYPAMKGKTLIEYLITNQDKFNIEYTNSITNSAGRRVRGFKRICLDTGMPDTGARRWVTVDSEDLPFINV